MNREQRRRHRKDALRAAAVLATIGRDIEDEAAFQIAAAQYDRDRDLAESNGEVGRCDLCAAQVGDDALYRVVVHPALDWDKFNALPRRDWGLVRDFGGTHVSFLQQVCERCAEQEHDAAVRIEGHRTELRETLEEQREGR